MGLKARRGAGATRTLGGRTNALNSKETAQERALWVVRQLIEAGLPPTLPDEYLAIVQLMNDYQRVTSGRKRRGTRSARCVSGTGGGSKESFTGRAAARVARPSAKKRSQPFLQS